MDVRLSLALAAGAVRLPEGRVVLMRPPSDLALDGLPSDLLAVHGFRPEHDALAARGLDVAAVLEGAADGAVVFAARARQLSLDMIARVCAALPAGAPVVVDGARGDGIESLLKRCRAAFDVGPVFAKAHGKCFGFPAAAAPDDWHAAPAMVDGFETAPGVFSADGIDPGSAALLAHLGGLSGRVCDLGAGWGLLSARLLETTAVTGCDLVEAEHAALDCARRNVTDPRAAFHWADATRWDGGPFDVVVTNPPFHGPRGADPEIGRAFVAAAARLLAPGGRLLMVANRHLPYETALDAAFAERRALSDASGYKVIEARRPRQRGKRA